MQQILSDPTAAGPRVTGSKRAGALWLVQVFSGLLLLVILALHMVAQHFVVEGGLRTYQDVVAYVSNPAVLVLELVFSVVVTLHALPGVRAVILDMRPSPATINIVNWALILAGIATVAYGTWLQFALQGW